MDGLKDVKSSYGGNLVLSAAMTAVAHPLTYVKVLIQVGHEPLPASQTTTFFGKNVMRLPNFFQYAGHIRKVDGFLGLYRGLGPRIAHNIVSSAVTNSLTNKLKEKKDYEDKEDISNTTVQSFLVETVTLAIPKTAGIIVSYPFHLISIRMMVQFVGRENSYRNIFTSIQDIYKEEGILGFFSGLIPHLVGELIALWMFKTINFLAQKYLIDDEYNKITEVRNYTQGISQYIASMVTYPFQLVTNIMAINDSNLSAGNPPLMPIYTSWTECWFDLGKKGLRNRGSTLFRRTVMS